MASDLSAKPWPEVVCVQSRGEMLPLDPGSVDRECEEAPIAQRMGCTAIMRCLHGCMAAVASLRAHACVVSCLLRGQPASVLAPA